MDDREYFLTAAQKAVKEKYPPVSKKYECECGFLQCFPEGGRDRPTDPPTHRPR
ncbi:hypothetical protein chiPu_0026795, partial [Chiloscyllium punctatum]|nr:hypothetical protein [Chiloscyllium punctatum]